MKRNMLLTVAALMAGSAALTVPAAVHAGGLFGDGGLFRGSIGNFLDEHVEKPVLTPVARGTAVVAGAAVGAAVGTAVGAPQAGALVGAGVGQAVNDAAEGK